MKRIIWKIINRLPNKVRYFMTYTITRRKIPNLITPRDYSEYIFKDILLNKNHDRRVLADKYRVRDVLKQKGYEFLLPELYGSWLDANDIDFDKLPNQFALKCNHGCGYNIICSNKSELDKQSTIEQLNKWMSEKHPVYFESHYRQIEPLIFCEEYIEDKTTGEFPADYKFHCANGESVFIQLAYNRTKFDSGKRVILDNNWKNLNFVEDDKKKGLSTPEKPKNLANMIEYASELSKGMDYVRVDLYDTGDKVYFGEYTLTPMGGWLSYFSNEALKYMGNKIKYNKKKRTY